MVYKPDCTSMHSRKMSILSRNVTEHAEFSSANLSHETNKSSNNTACMRFSDDECTMLLEQLKLFINLFEPRLLYANANFMKLLEKLFLNGCNIIIICTLDMYG